MAVDRKFLWLLEACVIFITISTVYGSAADTVACVAVKESYRSKGFDENHVPISAVSGSDLTICPQGKTCCTTSMENNMKLLSSKDHVYQIEQASKLARKVFASRTRKFDEFFTELMNEAYKNLHEMYLVTYGLGYQQNSVIFTELFDNLRDYYKGKDKNLMEVMNNFFINLFRRMLKLLNTNYDIDDSYLECATEYMDTLKPFADVPIKLSSHVNRGFIAARTFVQGLAIGRDVINTVVEVAPSESCVRAIVKMHHCPLCRGLTSTKPCNNYCLNTMKGCLAHHADLNAVWNEYIDAMEGLATKLEGPFNIESVVYPINLKLSDAIMNMQTNSSTISARVFAGCGNPPLKGNSTIHRNKRDGPAATSAAIGSQPAASSGEKRMALGGEKPSGGKRSSSGGKSRGPNPQEFLIEMGKRKGGRHNSASASRVSAPGTSLHRLVKDIRMKIKQTKDFWINLPHTVCNGDDIADMTENDCWNGHDRAKYIQEVQKDGSLQQINNPEVEVDVTKTNTVIHRQKIQTQLIISKLNHAIKGEDVDWIDTEIDDIESLSSGSGSGNYMEGSGSGYGIVTDEERKGIVDLDDSKKKKTGKDTHHKGGGRTPDTTHRGGKGGDHSQETPHKKGQKNSERGGDLIPDNKKPTDGNGDAGDGASIPSQAFAFLLLVLSIRGVVLHLMS